MNSLQQVRAYFDATGQSIAEWAAGNGFNPRHVYSVLNGRTRGRRGQAHEIAIALGLKSAEPAPMALEIRSSTPAAGDNAAEISMRR